VAAAVEPGVRRGSWIEAMLGAPSGTSLVKSILFQGL
jgi:hypothetical protein